MVLDAQGMVPNGPRPLPPLWAQGLVSDGGRDVVATDRVNFFFADARALYDDAIEMLSRGKIRNAAEKAWGATKRATGALVLARHGEEPQSAGQARPALLRLSAQDPAFYAVQGQYNTRSALLHVNCYYHVNCEPEREMADLIPATTTYILAVVPFFRNVACAP